MTISIKLTMESDPHHGPTFIVTLVGPNGEIELFSNPYSPVSVDAYAKRLSKILDVPIHDQIPPSDRDHYTQFEQNLQKNAKKLKKAFGIK